MALKNSVTGEVRRSYNITELEDAARLMRGYDLVALNAAGSGHAGGTLSIMDITAALYLRVANHDPQNPDWADRDRVIWSTGHKAPSLYLGLAFAGFCPIEDVVLLRPSTLAKAGRGRSLDRFAWPGAQHCRGYRAGGQAERKKLRDLLHHGRRGAAGRASLFAMCGLPNMSVVVPCDSVETRKATSHLLLEHKGPKYLRFAREATPVVTDEKTPFVFGKANVIRVRKPGDSFLNAFETMLESKYEDEREDLTIIACGPMVPEAMRAAWILKLEFGYETRVLNMHTLKPIDQMAIIRAAKQTGIILTAEEHQIGALAWRVSNVITSSPVLYGQPVITGAIGVKDRFGDSGAPWELIKEFEVSAEHIAHKAVELVDLKKNHRVPLADDLLTGSHRS